MPTWVFRVTAAAPGDREQGGSRPRLRTPCKRSRPYGFCQEMGQSRLDRAWTRTPPAQRAGCHRARDPADAAPGTLGCPGWMSAGADPGGHLAGCRRRRGHLAACRGCAGSAGCAATGSQPGQWPCFRRGRPTRSLPTRRAGPCSSTRWPTGGWWSGLPRRPGSQWPWSRASGSSSGMTPRTRTTSWSTVTGAGHRIGRCWPPVRSASWPASALPWPAADDRWAAAERPARRARCLHARS